MSVLPQSNPELKLLSQLRPHLLIVENVITDVEQIVISLASNGVTFTYDLAKTPLACQYWLENKIYDAVLADDDIPGLNGLQVLELVKVSKQVIPVILVSEGLGEQKAILYIKSGITNYVCKQTREQLPLVLENALQEFQNYRQSQEEFHQLKRQAYRDRMLNQLVQTMRATLVISDILQTIAEQLYEALKISRCLIFRPVENGSHRFECVNEVAQEGEEFTSPHAQKLFYKYYQKTFLRGQPLVLSQMDETLPKGILNSATAFNIRAMMMIPLLYHQSYLGWIILHQCDRERQWTRDELALVKAIADQSAMAIHQAELYEKAQTELAERKRAETALIESREQFAMMTENIPGAVYRLILNPNNSISLPYISQGVKDIIGLDAQELMEHPQQLLEVIDSQDREIFYKGFQECQKTRKATHREYRIFTVQGQLKWIRDDSRAFRKASGEVIIDGVFLDITDRKKAERALRESEQRFRSLIENATDLTAILDAEGVLKYVSPSVKRILGYYPKIAIGKNVLEVIHPDDQILVRQILKKVLYNPNIIQSTIEYRVRHRQGHWSVLEAVTTNLLQDHAVEGIVVNCHDITQRKLVEEQLLHDGLHDALTGLPNRALFTDRLQHALRLAKRRKDYHFAVLFLDLDRFKVVNDSLGLVIGDQLLILIARRLETTLRTGDTVARLGGDEFVILLEDIEGVSTATLIANRIQQELSSPLILGDHEVFITASIGIALSSHDYEHPAHLLRDADNAMYRAKELGRARHEIFERTMHAHALRLLQLENDLRRAIESLKRIEKETENEKDIHPQFLLHYQPIVCLKNRKISGFEALVRWQHPERGFISPGEFIPVAEETGLIVPLGKWVLRSACQQLREWQEYFTDRPYLTMNVNLSVKQFRQPDLIEQIDQILSETQLDGHHLKLEITESAIMENAESVTQMLMQLKSRKIHLCIDDFGTGYSSLSYLHRFPTDTLKIDRSFVSRIGVKLEEKLGIDPIEIVRSIITLSHNLGMDVVAEGVEVPEQVALLTELECDYGQGYFFSRPIDSAMARELLSMDEKDSHYFIENQS